MWNIIFLGMVSFFADISSEMVYPIIPLYLTSAFGATPALVGIIEGIAESLASLLKVFSGYITDKYRHKKAVAFTGYAAGLVYKAALIMAGSWMGILGARMSDRIGKGIRTAPRDVMVCESAEKGRTGQAYGIHKALDMAGSALGILFSYLLLRNAGAAGYSSDYKRIFLLACIPAVLSLLMFFLIREKKTECAVKEREPFWKNMRKLDGQLKLYLLVAFLFTLGNSSNTFLLLRARSAGFDDTSVILLYFAYNITASLLAIPAGKRSDQVGRKQLLVAGYAVFAVVYMGFAFAWSRPLMAALFVLYGLYTAMIAGVERAYISEIAPAELKGTMLGLHSTVVGIALLPASMIAGFLWDLFGAWVSFVFGSCMALAAAVLLFFFMKSGKPE